MKLFYGGAEVPGWRKLLAEERVPSVSLSYVGLTRRIKKLNDWALAEKFPADPGFRQDILLDSGAYSLNKEGASYTDADVVALAAGYFTFVANNIDRIDVYTEFDVIQLESAERVEMRETLAAIAPDKFMPIWHHQDGVNHLEHLADTYARVGILQPAQEAVSDLSPVLRRLASKTKLHGVAMTRMAAMQDLPWDSVGSTSWLSPGQYGDTFVWAHGELHRYPVKYKQRSRRENRAAIESAGFDAEAIARDGTDEGTTEDRKEVLRLSLWSWGQFVEDINRRREVVTQVAESHGAEIEESGPRGVDKRRGRARNDELVPVARQKTLLPVLSVTQAAVNDAGEGTETEALVGISTGNLMRCNTCEVKDKCPRFEPNAECAFEIPMVIRTSTQARALRKMLLEIQAQRVVTMRMFEQLNGGYADGNLSAEIMRLNKMLADDLAADRERASLKIEVTTDGHSGFMERMFGSQVEQKVNALAEPIDASKMLESSGIFDAEIVEDGPSA